ncbi:MAG: fibronectin type III domain-containing protein [Phycisphaerae bacterium]|nr:fibronectin type III domain-containing protein [Saprospiraceae bacterium]
MFKTILLAMAWLVFFGGKTAAPNIQPETSDETLKCSLPAPKNVHWTIAGTSYVFFEWDPVPGAAYFRVKVFNSPSNIMIYSRLVTAVPGKNGIVVNDLAAGTSFNLEVHSVCSNGVDSPKPN